MTPAAHRPRSAWIAVVGAWTGAALLLATQAYFAGAIRGDSVAWSRSLAIWLAWASVWALLTPIVLWLAARFPLERPRLARSLLIHGASSAILVVFDLALLLALRCYTSRFAMRDRAWQRTPPKEWGSRTRALVSSCSMAIRTPFIWHPRQAAGFS